MPASQPDFVLPCRQWTDPLAYRRPSDPAPRQSRPAKRPRKPRRSPLGPLFMLAVVGVVAGVTLFPNMRAVAAAALPTASPAAAFGKGHVRILLMGADRDYGTRGEVLAKAGRSDTMMLADVNFEDGRVHVCSIPRDTQVRIPGYGRRRINSAYALGGADLATETVENLVGLDIDHTVAVDLDAFKDAVDALGGVEVDVKKALKYDDNWGNLHINIPEGRQKLDGERAMQFVRFRADAEADIGRARRQQAFVRALTAAMKRPSNVVAWPGVVEAVRSHTETDLSAAQMVALGRFAKGLDSGQMSTETLPGRPRAARWQPDTEGIRMMAARLSD